MMKRSSDHYRRGVSLTELLLLMSSCTMILSLCGLLLHRVMQVEVKSRAFVDIERTAQRLGRQFRSDVHRAVAVEVDRAKLPENVVLQLQLPEAQAVEYRFQRGILFRTSLHNGEPGSREEFAFAPSCKLSVQQMKSPDRIALTMLNGVLDPAADKAEQLQAYHTAPLAMQLESTLGREVLGQKATVEQVPAR